MLLFPNLTRCFLDYYWEELWRGLLSLLDFLATKVENVDVPTGTLFGEVGRSYQEIFVAHAPQAIILVNFALYHSEAFLSTPQAVHQFLVSSLRT